jgi:hypothetical protein
LISHEVIVNLIGHTTTDAGLTIQAELDENYYPTGIKVIDEDLKGVTFRLQSFMAWIGSMPSTRDDKGYENGQLFIYGYLGTSTK